MIKNILKFSAAGLAIVLIGVGAISGIQYLKYTYSDDYKAEQALKKLVEEYDNDPYGGTTPEETLKLFIDALKKGDVDLATKYSVMEKQKETKTYLLEIKMDGKLNNLISDLQKTKLTVNENNAFFSLTDKNNVVISELLMKKHPTNGRWKIEEF